MSISNVGGNPYASHTGYIPTVTVKGRTYGVSKTTNQDENSNKSNNQATQNAQSVEASKKSSYSYTSHKGSIPTVTVNGKTYGPGKTSNNGESTSTLKEKDTPIALASKASKKSSSPYNHTGYIPYAKVNGRTYGLGKPTSTLNTQG